MATRALGDVGEKRELALALAALLAGESDGVVAAETGIAKGRRLCDPLAAVHGAVKTVHGNESQAVGADELAHLFHIHAVGEKLVGGGRIDAIETGMRRRRTGDAEMHLARAGIAHHLDDLARSGA